MSPWLQRYLTRLESVIHSRREIEIETLEVIGRSRKSGQFTLFRAKLRFFDRSSLQVYEALTMRRMRVARDRYSYQYSDVEGNTLFRYDNVPHYPEISTYPDHKHTPAGIEPANAPDLTDVLREIDEWLYGK